MRSKEENSSSSSSSVAFTDAFAAAAMASIIMLRRCCQQSPRYVLYFRSRSSSVMASHAALPTFASTATIAAAATMRRVQRAPLHVSVIRTVSSHSRCSPMLSGDGPPAAAQLPASCFRSCSAFHASSKPREYERMRFSMWASTALEVPPSGSIESPRRHTSSMVPS